MARIEGQRRQHRKDVRVEVLLQPLDPSPACSRPARRSGCPRPPAAAAANATSTPTAGPSARARAAGSRPAPARCSSPSIETSSMSARNFFRMVATRTMKNSSRFEAVIDEELHALEQRMERVLRLRQHALVELEPAQLAIDIERGRARDRPGRAPTSRRPAAGCGRHFDRFGARARGRSASDAALPATTGNRPELTCGGSGEQSCGVDQHSKGGRARCPALAGQQSRIAVGPERHGEHDRRRRQVRAPSRPIAAHTNAVACASTAVQDARSVSSPFERRAPPRTTSTA